jgi:hypothetical protein
MAKKRKEPPKTGHEALIRTLGRIWKDVNQIDLKELDQVWSEAHSVKPTRPDKDPPEAFKVPRRRIDLLRRFVGMIREGIEA